MFSTHRSNSTLVSAVVLFFFFFSSRRRHTRCSRDWSSDVCSSDLSSVRARVVPRGAQACCTDRGTTAGRAGACRRPAQGGRPRHRVRAEGAAGAENGRAACRGRGEILVVAASLKKKKKKEVSDGGI